MADDDLREGLERLAEAIEGQTERLAEATQTLAGERQARTDAIEAERRTRRVSISCVVVLLVAFAIIGWVEVDRSRTARDNDAATQQQNTYQSCRRGNELRGAIPEATSIAATTTLREVARLNLDPEEAAAIEGQLADIGASVQAEVAALEGMALRNCDEILEGANVPSLRPQTTAPAEQPTTDTTTGTSVPSGPYSSCAEAPGPIAKGDPGYSPDLDGDGDGTACE